MFANANDACQRSHIIYRACASFCSSGLYLLVGVPLAFRTCKHCFISKTAVFTGRAVFFWEFRFMPFSGRATSVCSKWANLNERWANLKMSLCYPRGQLKPEWANLSLVPCSLLWQIRLGTAWFSYQDNFYKSKSGRCAQQSISQRS